MHTDAQLFGFSCWMDAAIQGVDWSEALAASQFMIGAKALALGVCGRPAGSFLLETSAGAPRRFLDVCKEACASPAGHAGLQSVTGLGTVSWAGVVSEQGSSVLFFGLADEAIDPALLHCAASCAQIAVAARTRLNELRLASALKTAAFDRLPFGVAIVDQDCRVMEMNERCRALFARRDGLGVVQGKLVCRGLRDHLALAHAVTATMTPGETNDGAIIRVRRSAGAEPYVVRPISASSGGEQAASFCLLMIVDPDSAGGGDAEIWRAMFDLTECELIVAEGIVSGRRIADIASDRGVSIETVRTQAKRMFERLNVSSQAEAVARLSRTAPFSSESPRREAADT